MALSTTCPLPEPWRSSAGEVAEQVDGRERLLVLASDERERARDGDVVDVVAGHGGIRAVLAVAGEARVDELRVARERDLGPEPEPFHDAGAERLEQHVGLLDETQHRGDAVGMLEIDADRPLATGQQVGRAAAAPVDADDVRPEVGEDHAAVGGRRQAGHLDDADSSEGTHGRVA
jgi:hypothetical protein